MTPHKMHRPHSILLLVISLLTAGLMAGGDTPDAPVILVNDIDDSIQTLVWHKALSLGDVNSARKVVTGYTQCIYHLTKGTIKRYKFKKTALETIMMQPGDVVILGALYPEREESLKKIPALRAILEKLPAGERP